MNGNVKKLLCGNNTFQYRNGIIVNDMNKDTNETFELRRLIKDAVEKHILEFDLHETDISMSGRDF
jgi:hypothetical protein